jgi:hypothetical protein
MPIRPPLQRFNASTLSFRPCRMNRVADGINPVIYGMDGAKDGVGASGNGKTTTLQRVGWKAHSPTAYSAISLSWNSNVLRFNQLDLSATASNTDPIRIRSNNGTTTSRTIHWKFFKGAASTVHLEDAINLQIGQFVSLVGDIISKRMGCEVSSYVNRQFTERTAQTRDPPFV